MKGFVVRLNTLGLILTILGSSIVFIAILAGSQTGAGDRVILIITGLTPIGYCIVSSTLSWLFGAGFKLHITIKHITDILP